MLENVLNRGLPRSPRAQQLCHELAGRSLAVHLPDMVRVRLTSTGEALRIQVGNEPADAEVMGGPLSLLALSRARHPAAEQRGVEMRGDAETVERFRELLRLLAPDPEEELSLLFGDVPAHQLGRFLRAGGNWAQATAQTALTNVAEYLAHESRDLVPRAEAEQFLRGVDALREHADRLAARLALLSRTDSQR